MTGKNPDATPSMEGHLTGNVKEFFDSFAASYGQGRYFELRRAAVFQILAPYIENAQRILDLGCATDFILWNCASLASSVARLGWTSPRPCLPGLKRSWASAPISCAPMRSQSRSKRT